MVLEGICKEQSVLKGPVVDKNSGLVKIKNTLEGKLNGLAEKGILNNKQVEFLHKIRLLGNEALHELSDHSEKDLKICIDIIDHIIESLYILPKKVSRLKK
jgi:hypothetical protein